MTARSIHSKRLGPTAFALLIICCLFGWWQSTAASTGGPMSPAKVLWLFLAITHFYLVPFWLWRDQGLSQSWRRLWGLFFAGFAMRAVIELPLLLFTRVWRCEHGIAHDAVMMTLLILLSRKISREDQKEIRWFAWLTCLVLVCEALNAWLFSQVGDPASGIYFASSEERFRNINLLTSGEIAVCFPLFVMWLIHYVCSSR